MSGRRRVCGRWVGSRVKSSSPPGPPQLDVRRRKPNQSSGHNQIRIDLHTQPGTLGTEMCPPSAIGVLRKIAKRTSRQEITF